MRWRYIFHTIGVLLVGIGLCMLAPIGFPYITGMPDYGHCWSPWL